MRAESSQMEVCDFLCMNAVFYKCFIVIKGLYLYLNRIKVQKSEKVRVIFRLYSDFLRFDKCMFFLK